MSDQTTVTPLYGLKCGDPQHPEQGTIYGTCLSEQQARSLAAGVPCYTLVVSHDDGHTWTDAS